MKKLVLFLSICFAASTVQAAPMSKADWMNNMKQKIEAKGKKFNKKWAEKRFAKADTDGDGMLTKAERKAATKKK